MDREEAERDYERRRRQEQDAMRADTPGFWIVAGPIGIADQAIAMDLQRARFYPGTLPESLRLDLPHFDSLARGIGREKPFEPAFDQAFASLGPLLGSDQESRAIAAKLAKLSHARTQNETLRDLAGATFLYHQDEQGPLWGALTVGWDNAFLCSEDVDDLWDASTEAREAGQLASAQAAELLLNEMERLFGLGPASLHFASDGFHAFWGSDDAPSCLLEEHPKRAVQAFLEAQALGESAQTGAPAPKKPGL